MNGYWAMNEKLWEKERLWEKVKLKNCRYRKRA